MLIRFLMIPLIVQGRTIYKSMTQKLLGKELCLTCKYVI